MSIKAKKISIIVIAAVFALVAIVCTIGLFSVKKVQVNYAVSKGANTMEIQTTLDEFLGDSLVFLSIDKVKDAVDAYPYFEVTSVDKQFPNVLKVSIRERKETYFVKSGDNYVVTAQDGFVLRVATEDEVLHNSIRDKIHLNLEGISVESASVGSIIKTDNDALIKTVFEIADSVELINCVESITVTKYNVPGADLTFKTYSGVSIEIAKFEVKGVEMAVEAFNAYNNAESDYVKMYSFIKAYLVNGEINVVWASAKQ